MSETLTEREIEEQLELRRQRFEQVVQDIRRCLQLDLENFFVRETKKAFLGQSSVAESMTPERILALRKEAAALGKSDAARVYEALANMDSWRDGIKDADPEKEKSVLSLVSVVADAIQGSQTALSDFLKKHGFDVESAPVYKAPAFFVSGLYMPGLNEHFWKVIEEIRDLREQSKALKARVTREKLQALWDSAAEG